MLLLMEKMERFFGIMTVAALTFIVLPFFWITEGYLLFHILSENITILIALLLFIVGTRTYRYSKNTIVLFISVAYLFVAILGVLHALSYKGMDLIHNIDASMATQFWIARRLLEASSLLVATFIWKHELSFWKLTLGFAAITLGITASILARIFPVCFIEGVGLTPFKKISEFVIIILGILTLFRLKKFKVHLALVYVQVIGWAVVFGTAAEIVFTIYSTVYDIFNGMGHILYVFSSGLVGMFVVKEGLDKPYNIMFRSLYEKAIRDQLTGLFNRRGLEEMVHTSFERAKRFPATFCILMMDLDDFKMVNDEYGHPEGDLALAEFGKVLIKCFREYDIFARLGGDEFVVLLEDGEDITLAVKGRLEDAVEAWKQGNSRRRNLGITFGMTVRPAGSNASLESLLAEADAKLIAAKAAKRSHRNEKRPLHSLVGDAFGR
jgi:diguanylate cyclase (GGDEF)-like protein